MGNDPGAPKARRAGARRKASTPHHLATNEARSFTEEGFDAQLPAPVSGKGQALARREVFLSSGVELSELAPSLGTRADWTETAVDYLRQATAGRSEGTARVSIAALLLALDRIGKIEATRVAP
jgi:hypothetical protein